MLKVSPVRSSSDLNQFVRFPWSIYRDMPNWVPPLVSAQKRELNKSTGPFFTDGFCSDAEFFLCRDGREVVGRIAAIRNERHLTRQKDGVGFFGFFECVDQPEVARLLLVEAEKWLKQEGLFVSRGPTSFTINDTAGVMTKGQEIVPSFLMGYSPRYYEPLLESCGYRKVRDLLGYQLSIEDLEKNLFEFEDFFTEVSEGGVEIRPLRSKEIERDAELIAKVFSQSWDQNWGSFPLLPEELIRAARELGPIFEERLGYLAFVRGEPAGVFLAIPDPAEILLQLNGKFGAKGLLKVLCARGNYKRIRLLLLGTLSKYRDHPIAPLMIREIQNCKSNFPSLETVELFWILEENLPTRNLAETVGGRHTQTLRLFDKFI